MTLGFCKPEVSETLRVNFANINIVYTWYIQSVNLVHVQIRNCSYAKKIAVRLLKQRTKFSKKISMQFSKIIPIDQ